ncbi:hypothetical protein KR200_011131 [Drosophila serrata]|nr:hypothetical protein KR200_011131 [Drosophila serrata]
MLLEILKTVNVMLYKVGDCNPLRLSIQDSLKLFESTWKKIQDKTLSCDRLIFYALQGMSLLESGAIRSSIKFLEQFVMHLRNSAHIIEVVLATGEQTPYTAIMYVGYLATRSEVENFANIHLAINKNIRHIWLSG